MRQRASAQPSAPRRGSTARARIIAAWIAALAHKRTQGKRISHRIPMGYDLAPDGVHLHANEAEREVVHTITRLHASGWSSRKIIHELERQGLNPKGGGRWHPKVVLEIAARR